MIKWVNAFLEEIRTGLRDTEFLLRIAIIYLSETTILTIATVIILAILKKI